MLRQSLNIILLVAMILASNVEAVFGVGRSIADQSNRNDTLLVPWEFAFSIWGPIFLGLLAYVIIQGLPKNRNRPIFIRTGGWTALAFGMTALWGLAASLPPLEISRWATAFIFIPAVWGAVRATRLFTLGKAELSTLEHFLCWGPVSLYAGWMSIAVFLNWAQVGTHTFFGFGMSEVVVCFLVLALALAFASWQLHRLNGNKVYIFSILWGLGFLAYGRLAVDDLNTVIGVSAAIGAVILLVSAIIAGRRAAPANL